MSFLYGNIALLILACLLWLFIGYVAGLNERGRELRHEQLLRVRAEQRERHLQQLLDRNTPRPAGGPGRARANRHGGVTVLPAPPDRATGAQIVHLPTSHNQQGACK